MNRIRARLERLERQQGPDPAEMERLADIWLEAAVEWLGLVSRLGKTPRAALDDGDPPLPEALPDDGRDMIEDYLEFVKQGGGAR